MNELTLILKLSALMGLASAFVILAATKSGLIEDAASIAPPKINKLLNCDFCISFWVNVPIPLIAAAVTGNIDLAFLPFLATPITRALL